MSKTKQHYQMKKTQENTNHFNTFIEFLTKTAYKSFKNMGYLFKCVQKKALRMNREFL